MEAIKEIPKLGRRKVPLHEKHYGRNELIAAYILKETQQSRTLMELLSDASPDESNDPEWLEAAMSKIRKIFGEDTLQDAPPSPVSPISPTDSIYERFSHLGHHTNITSASRGDDDNNNSRERRPTHNRQLSIASILNPEPEDDPHHSSNSGSQHMHSSSPQSRGTPEPTMQPRHDEALPSSWQQEHYGQDHGVMASRMGSGTSWLSSYNSRHSPSRSPELDVIVEGQTPVRYLPSTSSSIGRPSSGHQQQHHQQHHQQQQPSVQNNYTYDPTRSQLSDRYPFWPCQYQLVLDEDPSQGHGRSTVLVENVTPFYDHLPCRDVSMLDEPRFPYIKQLFNEKRGTLFLYTKLGLNLKDCAYRQVINLTSRNMFQSRERMTVQCQTSVFSFGKQVISSTETRPAEVFKGRYVYRIEMVDRWLQDYLQTLWEEGRREDEMESFLYNLTIVQEFSACSPREDIDEEVGEEEDMEGGMEEDRRPMVKGPSLLVVAFEFCAGQGAGGAHGGGAMQSSSSQSYRLTSGPPPASVRARSNTWDHPMPSLPWHLSGYTGPGSSIDTSGGSPWMGGHGHGHGGMYADVRGSGLGPIKRTSGAVTAGHHHLPQREWPPQPKRSRKESFSGFSSPYS
ncbi:hypothetical protein BGZ95_010483 [Linnemannia exigua]|uniref:TEA domain-containing protein n=1 Tax=Linnemannia exigua TaxID=604196 RepID=A0AAD4H744_9FUNG|nr:hypothetical protein BGZ95_010483 [Linnemannia exigua]